MAVYKIVDRHVNLLGALLIFLFGFGWPHSQLSAQTTVQAKATPDNASTTVEAELSGTSKGSLGRVPSDAGFYFTTTNHQAIAERFFTSQAWANLKSCDVARGMKKAYRRGKSRGYEDYNPNNPFAQYLKGYGDTVGSVGFQSFWQIAKEIFQNELFVYFDNDSVEFSRIASELQVELIDSMVDIGLDGLADGDLDGAQALAMWETVEKRLADLEVPTVIVGARLDHPKEFQGILELLEGLIESGFEMVPDELEWTKSLWHVTRHENHYLMSIDVTADQIPFEELFPEQNITIPDSIKDKQISIVVGIVDDLLMIGVADGKEKLISFGSEELMIDLPIANKLRRAIDRNETITHVIYHSKEFARQRYSFDQASSLLKTYLKLYVGIAMSEAANEAEKTRLLERGAAFIEEFLSDLKALLAEPAPFVQFSHLSDEGMRFVTVSGTQSKTVDASKPLELAQHVGPDTLMVVSTRSEQLAQQYRFVSKWFKMLLDNVPKTSESQMTKFIEFALEDEMEDLPDEEDIQVVLDIFSDCQRIFNEIDDVAKKQLLPSIDGEIGLFVNMSRGPLAWCEDMSPSQRPLPLPFPALVIKHNNADQIIDAGKQYLNITNAAIATGVDRYNEVLAMSEENFNPQKIGKPFQIPEPQRSTELGDVSFRWSVLTDYFGAAPEIKTGARMSKNWLVLNLFPAQAKQLQKPATETSLFGPAKTNQPSAMLMFFDNQVLVSGVKDWVNYAVALDDGEVFDLTKYTAKRDTLQFTTAQLREAFDRCLDVAGCFKGISSRTYEASDTTVNESLVKFSDVPSP